MRTRHRIPTIFNLSMVDVLCCALGCVILLWLVNFREAKRKAAAAGETSTLLADARGKLDAALLANADDREKLQALDQRLRAALSERDAAGARAAGLAKERDQLGKDRARLTDDLMAARARGDALEKDASALKNALTASEDRLLKKGADYLALARERDASAKLLEAQQKMTREKDVQFQAASRAADDVAALLRESDKKGRGLADELTKLRDEAKVNRDRLAGSESRFASLQADLTAQKSLTTQAVQARLAAENRFAGITLTGRRVVFLVDMSGSMDYVDEKTLAPDKWKGVRESLVKIMRSLPELEKFQVVLFSDKASYLLGNDDRWLIYDPKISPDRAMQALATMKPTGNTNMYAAFEAAFRFRGDGLDTIYLLSDGLPNIGGGLTVEQARKLTEFQRTDILSQHVRKTLKTTWNRPDANRQQVRINAVGFFYESPDVGAFLWALARENDGSFVGMSKP
ncbi:hypothetical protein AYO44_02345 [Planctomycetaceae bacterium SCGC AG-212-F19]|nr:hypothetical protein AYO44_02345 [Planctomycetaceae bacterium SCGC AG-212-F19]